MLGVKIADLFAGLRLDVDEKSWAAGDKLLGTIKAGLGAIAAWQGFRWAKGLVDETTAIAKNFDRMAQRVGIASEALQGYAHAALTTGVETDNFVEFLQDLQEKGREATKGVKEYATAYRDLGVNLKDSNGKLKSGEQLMLEVADRFSQMEDGGAKTAITMKLFSDEGTRMIPMLNLGSERIKELKKEFEDLGGVIDADATKALREFDGEQIRLKASLGAIRNQAVMAVLPALREITTAMLEWVKANRDLIRQRLETLLNVVVKVMKVLLKVFNVFMKAVDVAAGFLSNWFEIISENWKLIEQAAFAAAGAMAAFKWQAIQAAIATMAAWAVPIAAIAGILLLVEDLWVWSKGGDSLIGSLHQGLVDLFVKAIEFWVKEFDDFVDYMVKKLKSIPQSLKDGVTEFFTGDTVRENSVGSAVNVGQQIAGNRAEARQLAWSNADREFLGASPVWQQQHPERDPRIRQATINAPITINGTGMDAVAIAKAVQDKLDAAWRGAQAALED